MATIASTNRTNHIVNSQHPERLDAVVIGGGQAGLATGYHLAQYGFRFVILDAHDRIGDSWRNRWDSLRLFSPTRYNNLPGKRLRTAGSFPTKDELADYFEQYATDMDLPVRTATRARHVYRSHDGNGAYCVETDAQRFEADHVVIATGGYQDPKVPAFASALDPGIVQIHSHDYRNPSQLQHGDVLVVGASNSGAEIAIEAARDHSTILAGRDPGQIPFRIERPIAKVVFPVLWFTANHILTVNTPMGRKMKPQVRSHGGPLVRIKRSDVEAAGVERTPARVTGVQDGMSVLDDGRVLDVRNIIWCTGFHSDYSWIEGLSLGEDGYPEQDRGIVSSMPGLYFVGLKVQYSFASMLVGGAGRDAKQVVDRIAASVRQVA